MTHMTLSLVAVSLNDQPLSQPITAVFDARGGTIGRADHNTMTLPDPQRHISRLQAEVVLHGREYLIRNVGAANPIQVGSRTLANGELAPVADEEHVRIGGYLLKARLGEAVAPPPAAVLAAPPVPAPPPITPPIATPPIAAPAMAEPAVAPPPVRVPAPPSPVALPADPFADLLGPSPAQPALSPVAPSPDPFADLLGPSAAGAAAVSTAGDPFADLLGPSSVPSAPVAPAAFSPPPAYAPALSPAPSVDPFADLLPPPAGVHARSAAVAPAAPAAARLPDDFDPFAATAVPRPASATTAPADPFADLMGGAAAAPSIDALFGLGGTAGAAPFGAAAAPADPLADFMAQAERGGPGSGPGAGLSTDPLALFGAGAAAAVPAHADIAQPDQVPAVHAAWQPPQVQAPAAPVAPMPAPPAAASTPVSPAEAAALWAAFCQGAGIDVRVPPQEVAARLQIIGRILRSAVDGTLQLVAVRASTKHELRAGVTVIQQRGNNPLKFTPDAGSALEQLLQPPLRGFLDGPAAMDDAMHDLVGHAIGSVAGLRAAVEGMLDRFAPDALEAKLSDGSFLDSVLPMNRKARLWALYLQHSQAIREEAQEDFHTLFGKAFVAAYQQQIDRLDGSGGGGGRS